MAINKCTTDVEIEDDEYLNGKSIEHHIKLLGVIHNKIWEFYFYSANYGETNKCYELLKFYCSYYKKVMKSLLDRYSFPNEGLIKSLKVNIRLNNSKEE